MVDTLKPGSSPFSALSLSTSLLRVAIFVLACDLSLLNLVSAFEFNSWKVRRVGLVRTHGWWEDVDGVMIGMVWGCGWYEDVGGVRVWVVWGCGWCEDVGGVRVWVVWGCGWYEDVCGVRVWVVWGCGWCEDVGGVRMWVVWGYGWCEGMGGVRVWVMWGCARWDVPETPVLSRSAVSSAQSPFLCEQPAPSEPLPAHWDLCHTPQRQAINSNCTEYWTIQPHLNSNIRSSK